MLAGVNGVAVGMGVSLAMCADIRIAAPSARFHPGYARVGASPDGGLTWTLPEALGRERAMRFFLEQRMISAVEALDLGMVGEVTGPDVAFEERFVEYGRMLAGVAPIAAQQTKRLVGEVARPPICRRISPRRSASRCRPSRPRTARRRCGRWRRATSRRSPAADGRVAWQQPAPGR